MKYITALQRFSSQQSPKRADSKSWFVCKQHITTSLKRNSFHPQRNSLKLQVSEFFSFSSMIFWGAHFPATAHLQANLPTFPKRNCPFSCFPLLTQRMLLYHSHCFAVYCFTMFSGKFLMPHVYIFHHLSPIEYGSYFEL